jgi:hypothetical protein
VIKAVTRSLWVAIALVAAVLPLVPLASWSGAPDSGPAWRLSLDAWGLGLLVVVALALATGRLATGLPRVRLPRPALGDVWYVALLAALIVLGAATASWVIFARNPHHLDEMAQLIHAGALAAGRLALPTPEPAQAFLTGQTWVTDAGWVSQYPPGHIVLLAVGRLARAVWLVNPVLAGVGAVCVFFVARGLYGRRVARTAVFLWVVSAWVLFMSAGYMNHVTAVTFALVAWALVWGPRRPRALHWIAAGMAIGWVTATRPLEGLAAALPLLVWAARGRTRVLPWIALGGLPVAVAWGYVNWRLYGSPLTLGYSVLYGAEHNLGFHTDPWGQPFTPAIALSNVAMAVRRLHIYLYEWPIPALLPLALWAAFGKQRRERDLVVAVGLMAAPALYFFYWHSGFHLGPRFYYAIVPWLVIATARGWHWGRAAARRAGGRVFRWNVALGTAAVTVLVWGWIGVLPGRIEQYRTSLPTMKLHPEKELKRQGVTKALVLVRTSWGSRIISGLWEQGVPPGLVERAYRRIDTCQLDTFWREARGRSLSAARATQELELILANRGAVEAPRLEGWPDPTVRATSGNVITEACRREMQRDQRGFTLYEPLAWRNAIGLDDGIVFARDLLGGNGPLLVRFRGWPLWRYAPSHDDPEGLPVLTQALEVPLNVP